jgi:hypothetical protein
MPQKWADRKKKPYRDRHEYYRMYRETKTISKGLIPRIKGNQFYLTVDEEAQLVEKIVSWTNPLTQPTLADIPRMVFSFFCISDLFFHSQLGS